MPLRRPGEAAQLALTEALSRKEFMTATSSDGQITIPMEYEAATQAALRDIAGDVSVHLQWRLRIADDTVMPLFKSSLLAHILTSWK